MNVIVGISWPFADGKLHIGHLGSSLSGDVIARYHRQKGNNVILVSGTDCHGTPIDIKAIKEGISQKKLVDECHKSFEKDWKDIGFSYDLYNRTDDIYHKKFVQEQFEKYYDNGFLYEKKEEQLYCENCKLFLADRYIIGICPKCGSDIKGDECEKCGSLLEISNVKNKKCAICNNEAFVKQTKNLYFKLSTFEKDIKKLVETNKNNWRENAILFAERYLKEGIPDRCASRSLNWGIDIPIKGYEDKKIYGWFENVWGYVTASKKYAEENNIDIKDFWNKERDNKIYLVHAKDNIPFHTVIFPALLLATGDNYKLPDKIISDEYITIEGEKISKSKDYSISIRYLLDRYPVDTIRYFFINNDPDKRDFNFTFDGFINSNNGELLGKWGNFVNRTLQFINKSFDGKIEECTINKTIEEKIIDLYSNVGRSIDAGNVKEGIKEIFNFVSYANKYFDELEPWNLYKTDVEKCKIVLYNCINIILNVNNILKPFLIETTKEVESYLNCTIDGWKYKKILDVHLKNEIKPLFIRYDKELIEKERIYLNNIKK